MAISTGIPAVFDKSIDIRVPHYVAGRKLTSEDLKDERKAALQHLQFVGRAAGKGIIEGLWVEALGKNQLTISAGLGINGVGHPIALTSPATLTVVLSPTPGTPQNNIAFGPCSPTMTINTNGLQNGPYLLTAVPVYQLSTEMTPVQKVLPRGTQEDCTNKWEVEGISFRAVYLGQPDIPQGYADEVIPIPPNADSARIKEIQEQIRKRRQNYLVNWVYGTDKLLSQIRDPFQKWDDLYYSGFGISRVKFEAANDLTDCDLYLAVFYLGLDANNAQSIQFVDNWSVRRRLSHAFQFPLIAQNSGTAGFTGWSQRLNDQLAAEGEARFAQFQEQFDALRQQSSASLMANQHFRYLPSAGFVPLLASDKLIKAISQYMVDLLRSEIQKSGANPKNSQLIPNLMGISSIGGNGHVYEQDGNILITQINNAFNSIASSANALALPGKQNPITIDSMEPFRPYNSADHEIDSNDHVLLPAYNGRVLAAINANLPRLINLVNQLSITYAPTIAPSPIAEAVGDPVNLAGITYHVTADSLNSTLISPLNTLINRMISNIKLVISGRADAWKAVNDNLEQISADLQSQLQTSLSTTTTTPFVSSSNGVALETFFYKDPRTNYIQNLAFTDRQAIESILGNSWRTPAIDLNNDQNLSFIMVYEDIIPDALEKMRDIIEKGQFVNQPDLYKVWSLDINVVFNRIIANKSSKKPPLYGLFTQAVYPLQMTIWQQEAAILNERPEIKKPSADNNIELAKINEA